MKYLFLAFTFLACTAVAPPPRASQSNMAADLASQTVALVNSHGAYCSGVWVSNTDFLTAAHCVSDGADIKYSVVRDVSHWGSEEIVVQRSAKVRAVDYDHDLAVVRASDPPGHGVATPSLDSISPGDSVYTMGHPLGLWWSYSSGEVSAVRFLDDGLSPPQWWIQTTAPISPGNSGCGLYDARGRLIGIGHATFANGQNLNLFVHRQYLTSFLLT